MVVLTPPEITIGAMVGVMRQVYAIKRNSEQYAGHPEDKDWQSAIEGALGEMAFAKSAKLYWEASVNTYRRFGDVYGWEVRAHWYKGPDRSMLIRKRDSDDRKYVMMNGINGTYERVGWILGAEAKRSEWLSNAKRPDRPPCWWVPATALNPEFPFDE